MPAATVPKPAEQKRTLKIPATLYRAATIERSGEGENRVFKMSVSSDVPYKRYDWMEDEDYYEVLDHAPGGISDGRLRSEGLPILWGHDQNQPLGVAKSWNNDGHKLTVADFIWSTSEFAQTKKKDAEIGALPYTSVGYKIVGEGECIGAQDGIPVYKFRWEINEASIVSVAADISVGPNRGQAFQRSDDKPSSYIEISVRPTKDIDSPEKTDETRTTQTAPMPEAPAAPVELKPAAPAAAPVDEKAIRAAGRADYKARCKRITEHVESDTMKKWPEWQKAGRTIAAKHFEDDEPNFEKCIFEINGAFNPDAQRIDTDSNRDIQVVSEQFDPSRRTTSDWRTLGEQFLNSAPVKALNGRLPNGGAVAVDMPNFSMLGARGKLPFAQTRGAQSMSTRSGFTSADLAAVNLTVQPGIVALGVQRLTIMDVIGTGTLSSGAIKYARENSLGTVDGVAPTAPYMARAKAVGERGLKPLWDPDLTTETAAASKIPITTKVPDEFLADFPYAMTFINNRLPFMVDTETEFQILYGDGLNNNLKGIFSTGGVQSRPIVTTDDSTKAASLRQGLTDVQVYSQFEPDFFAFHPFDWETACLLKDDDKRFLAGGPFYIPLTDGVYVERFTFWGKPVVISLAVTYGQPICGAGKLGASALIREGMRLEMTNSNEDDFRRNLICLRAEHRLALPVYRPVAFLQFTGWPARAA